VVEKGGDDVEIEKLLDTKEVAEWLKVSERQVTKMAVGRQIAAIKIGSIWRFRPQDIEAYIKQHRSEPPEASIA
jgi:excisionase family DNA binding protein